MKPLLTLPALTLLAACMAPPGPLPTGEITWPQALELFKACKVTAAFQDHQRNVGLTLVDGSQVTTVEPALDDIFYSEELAPGCPPYALITE